MAMNSIGVQHSVLRGPSIPMNPMLVNQFKIQSASSFHVGWLSTEPTRAGKRVAARARVRALLTMLGGTSRLMYSSVERKASVSW
jgi:hypothetical protein